jgi:NO-binding membrane sensor protein with MHYT domain
MTNGLILLAFLGILAAVFTVRLRKRMGIASNAKTWYSIVIGVILVGLTIWAASTH